METKQIHVEIKDEDEGVVTARFATLGQKDLDGDVIEAGAFGEQQVKVSAYGHTSWGGALPVGVGATREKGDEAIAELKFFMNTTHGRDHFETVKGLGALGEWSFGFDILEEAAPSEEQREKGVHRVLKRLKVHEVSPVLRGAGVGTQTLGVKCDSCAAKGEATPEEPEGEPEAKAGEEPETEHKEGEDDECLDSVIRAEVGRFELIKARMEEGPGR